MAEPAFGKRAASSWASALLPSWVHTRQPVRLSDVWAADIQARVCASVSVVSACPGLFGVAQQLLWHRLWLSYGCE